MSVVPPAAAHLNPGHETRYGNQAMSEILEQYIVILSLALMIFLLVGKLFNFICYTLMKERIIAGQQWDLNICCGKTDAGKINADIVKHARIANFVLIKDIYNLPFADKQF
jgi:hypothetical protein